MITHADFTGASGHYSLFAWFSTTETCRKTLVRDDGMTGERRQMLRRSNSIQAQRAGICREQACLGLDAPIQERGPSTISFVAPAGRNGP